MEYITPEIGKAFKNLAAEIVIQAIKDYKESFNIAKNAKRKSKRVYEAEKLLKDCKRFFLSDWFVALCEVDGNRIMKLCEENCSIKIGKKQI